MISRKLADRVLELDVLARRARELLGDEVRLRQEALDAPRPRDDDLVLVGELVHAEDRDDVLQVGVALEDLLDERRDLVVLVGDDARLQRARRRLERIDGRVDALLHDRALEHGRRVEVRERVRGRGVGEVVGRHVDRLHGRHRAGPRRGDPLLELRPSPSRASAGSRRRSACGRGAPRPRSPPGRTGRCCR